MKINDDPSMPESMKQFRKLVRELMERDNVSLPRLAELSGQEYATLWTLVNGNTLTPRPNVIMGLVRAFQLDQEPELLHRFVNAYFFTQFSESWLNTAGFQLEEAET